MSPYGVVLYKCCTLVRKCIDGNVCKNFENYFVQLQNNRVTRNKGHLLKLPKIRLEYSRSSFSYMGAKHYNVLPLCIKSQESFMAFKSELWKHLVQQKWTFWFSFLRDCLPFQLLDFYSWFLSISQSELRCGFYRL